MTLKNTQICSKDFYGRADESPLFGQTIYGSQTESEQCKWTNKTISRILLTPLLLLCLFLSCQSNSELAAVQQDGKWGYINRSGKKVIPCKYEKVGDFSEGLASVRQNGKWGYIDKSGNKVIPFEYEKARDLLLFNKMGNMGMLIKLAIK